MKITDQYPYVIVKHWVDEHRMQIVDLAEDETRARDRRWNAHMSDLEIGQTIAFTIEHVSLWTATLIIVNRVDPVR